MVSQSRTFGKPGLSNGGSRDCDLKFGQGPHDEMDDFYKFQERSPTEYVFESSYKPPQGVDYVGQDGWSAKLWGDAECRYSFRSLDCVGS